MKKLLFGILTFLGIGLSFCNAQNVSDKITWLVQNEYKEFNLAAGNSRYFTLYDIGTDYGTYCIVFNDFVVDYTSNNTTLSFGFVGSSDYTQTNGVYVGSTNSNTRPTNRYMAYQNQAGQYYCIYGSKQFLNIGNIYLGAVNNTYQSIRGSITYSIFKLNTLLDESIITSCPSSSINVLYNNENSSSTITCNGDNVIQIDGLSTITSTNKRTPYFNINYRDEDNQLLTESYSKDILYLSGSLFKKTYTGNNERILTSPNNNKVSFSGYVPTFDVVFTGDTWEDTGNVFNNFAQNSLQVALSNIPSYIQYVIIIMLLFFILGLARRKKRR